MQPMLVVPEQRQIERKPFAGAQKVFSQARFPKRARIQRTRRERRLQQASQTNCGSFGAAIACIASPIAVSRTSLRSQVPAGILDAALDAVRYNIYSREKPLFATRYFGEDNLIIRLVQAMASSSQLISMRWDKIGSAMKLAYPGRA